ncbi:hypothetical protein TWF569_004857 [Orbilia oligospora]|uniref:Peptidase A1 domain-containing protein n=1 Tax=Orbilia oligospora TaxID=2813651 RepID=A0A7C8NRL7_ORBOL|nr:hypothetical protein TWF102_011096 [Orbilia oligospora]KAF3088182.1 hypothetical protein TWF706_010954 [Orbilia oligospora]KAF3094220.1 hypothetical protein TWF103_010617 [Orbilia oligospora]KAF3131787.1 hypothetical protein TWF703_007506 [Orbilia oligospora]KAF3149944.1 hypothetical protein TWF569_004857 [Orbilia oligospora]
MASNFSRWILPVLSVFILLSPALQATKTFTLDLIDESEKYHRNLFQRQAGDEWRSIDIIYNSTQFYFFVDVKIGDASKNLKLRVLQSAHTWVASPWSTTQDCPPLTEERPCSAARNSGFFSLYPPDSSSSRNLSARGSFDIEYNDYSYVIGNWVRDKFQIGQLTLDDVNFGVGRSYNATPAIGLGRSNSDSEYSTFLEVMQEKDIINTPSYGIYVGDIRGREGSSGSITFGGIDVAKFTRPLRTLSSKSSYALNLLGIDIVTEGKVVSRPLEQPEGLHRASTLSFSTVSIHIPTDVFNVVMAHLGAEEPYYSIRTLPPDDSGLNFTFTDGLSIFVPYSQMAVPVSGSDNQYFLLLLPNDKKIIMGTPFFRSAYIFYDFQNEEFSIAPALYNITASNVTEVGVNNASISDVKWLYENPTQSSIPSPSSELGVLNTAVIVGGAVGGSAVVAITVALCFYLFYYRPKHRGIIAVIPQTQGNGMGQAPPPVSHHNEHVNRQISPVKSSYSSPVTSPTLATSTAPWVRPENIAVLLVHVPTQTK